MVSYATSTILIIMKTKLIVSALALALMCLLTASANAQSPMPSSGKKPNILVIFGDDIGQSNVSAYSMGMMGYRTPNIDRIAREGMIFTDYYAEQSCTAGRRRSLLVNARCVLACRRSACRAPPSGSRTAT